MKVLVIPTWYPNGEDKLMGIYHKEYTSALNKYGIPANMLYIDRQRLKNPIKYIKMPKKIVEQEENYHTYIYRMLNLRPINFHLQMKSYTRVLEKAFKDYLKSNPKPDVLHAQVTVPAGYAAIKLGKKYNIPVVVTEHGGLLERFFKDEPYKRYGLEVLKHSHYTTVSNYMKDIALKYTNQCEVLPNQVNTDIFKNDVIRHIDGTFKLVSVCALREGKRLDIAFEAIKKLVEKSVNIHLDIIGDGFYEDVYKNIVHEYNLEEYVTFLGRMPKEEISKHLKESHALLISSEIESFAIPGIEALASGLPVITTDCLGPRDFIDNTTGVMTKVNDPDDLARGILELIEKYPLFKKEHLEEIADQFSEKNVINKAKGIYQKVINEGYKN